MGVGSAEVVCVREGRRVGTAVALPPAAPTPTLGDAFAVGFEDREGEGEKEWGPGVPEARAEGEGGGVPVIVGRLDAEEKGVGVVAPAGDAVKLGEPCGDHETDLGALPLRDAGKDGVSEGEELTEGLALEVVL